MKYPSVDFDRRLLPSQWPIPHPRLGFFMAFFTTALFTAFFTTAFFTAFFITAFFAGAFFAAFFDAAFFAMSGFLSPVISLTCVF